MRPWVAALGVLLLISGLPSVHAERVRRPACQVIRAEDAAILQKCDGELRSFALSMTGTERTVSPERSNKFRFSCRPGLCQGEPQISGWFVDPAVWNKSKQDEPAIFAALATDAGLKLPGSGEHMRSLYQPSCELSPVTFARLPGKMMCYETKSDSGSVSSTVVIVAADAEIGVVTMFQGPDAKKVLDYAVGTFRVFDLERGHGSSVLERWMQ